MADWRFNLVLGVICLALAVLFIAAPVAVMAAIFGFLAGASLMFALALWRES